MSYTLLEKKSEYLLSDGQYFFDDFDTNKIDIKIKKNSNVEILCKNINKINMINCEIEDGSYVKFLMLARSSKTNFTFLSTVKKDSKLDCYFADFSKEDSTINSVINLKNSNSTCNWNLSSLGMNQDNKKIDVNIYHKHSETFSLINNYGVSRNESKILFSGISHIEKGSARSKAHQNAKIMVFDKESSGVAKPILKIDENEIEASHAAVVGKISDDQLFYLCSRGLSVNQARQLITYGYLRPILNGFDDETKEEINTLIEERIWAMMFIK
mgnify:CR=1 FL=1